MAKSSKKSPIVSVETFDLEDDLSLDTFMPTEQPDVWDITDEGDRGFWNEFFQLENLLSVTDELDPPSFTITFQNHQTGEIKTFSNIHLSSSKKKLLA